MMRLWGLPLSDNEDVADEFATVIMILAKQQQPALQAAQWWATQTSQQEALSNGLMIVPRFHHRGLGILFNITTSRT